MLYRLAKLIGWKTLYHVAWTCPMAPGGFQSGDMTIEVYPWITSDNWKEARKYVAEKNGHQPDGIAVTSLTRI